MGLMPDAVPVPLIFGPSWPKIGIIMRDGRQHFESRTNRNLRLTDGDFTEEGTYTMARFLSTFEPCQPCTPEDFVDFLGLEEHRCCLVTSEVDFDEEGVPTDWKWWDPPDIWNCPAMQLLQELCQEEPQRRFLENYCRARIPLGVQRAYGRVVPAITKAVQEGGDESKSAELFHRLERLMREMQFSFPALIPEVWLNAIGYDKTPADEAHLSENPQRVDFVMFVGGQKCVIEIDGPSHYATFDKDTRRYQVSEEEYTRNLRIERSLRRQGWEIHRFSNHEVNVTDPLDFRRLLRDLPGGASVTVRDRDLSVELVDLDPDAIPF